MRYILLSCTLALAFVLALPYSVGSIEDASESRFYKGNTHAHTLWSDGDAAPQAVVAWYRDQGYDFLALTDHNTLQRGERWFPVAGEDTRDRRLTPDRLAKLQEHFGQEAIELRSRDERREMRLWTLEELRARFEVADEFLLLTGEEVTGGFEGLAVHINALGLEERLLPAEGDTLVELLNATLATIEEHGRTTSDPVVAQLDHPNFKWSIDWHELAAMGHGTRLFEVYNGHPAVNNAGDPEHPSTDEMWDRALSWRLTQGGLGLLYGVATDDGHHYHDIAPDLAVPGRGWVQVRAGELSARALTEALQAGDFYASSGVELTDFSVDASRYVVDLAPGAGETLVTRFIGTRAGTPQAVGEVLLETHSDPAIYEFRGDELYVRAVVTSNLAPLRPTSDDERRRAWLQPVVVR